MIRVVRFPEPADGMRGAAYSAASNRSGGPGGRRTAMPACRLTRHVNDSYG
jgi:hypothetical protein